ncbi:porin [Variovorax sp. DT-64]|uniref:porin n=1 Tax=Variovorax sp. DT-64 TaxID=3396160 RepID=UPI003F1A9A4C
MRKTLIAAAVMAAAGTASSQSSVTVFGVVDTAVSGFANKSRDLNGPTLANPFYLNQGDLTVRRRELRHSGHNTSRLGFRGVEDLGGGLAASFWLEAPITNDDGATGIANFSRRSTVSLSGPFGEVRLGRDYTPTFWNDSIFDPWAQTGSGASLLLTAGSRAPGGGFNANANYARASNTLGYFLPKSLGGFYGQLMYGFHENAKYDPGTATPPGVGPRGVPGPGAVAASRTGRYAGGRFGYASGPLDVALAYGSSYTGDSFYAGTTDTMKTANLGVSYDFGVVKLLGEVSRVKHARDYAITPAGGLVADVDVSGYLLAVTAPVGAGLIRAAYSHVRYDMNQPGVADPKAGKLALGYVHNLSKRTALYATVARVNNRNGAALNVNGGPTFIQTPIFTPRSSTGYDLGIRHAF